MTLSQSQRVRLGILGTPDSPYVADLQRAALQFPDVDVQILKFAELQACIALDPSAMAAAQSSAGIPQSERDRPEDNRTASARPEVSAVIVRSMPLGTLEQIIFRMDCLQVWESQGIHVVNPPRTLEVAIDKWLTLHRLQLAGLAVPATIVCQSRSAAMEAWQTLEQDVLVKPLFGGEGRGIVRLQDADTAWRVLGTLQQVGQVLYMQQFVQHFGYDIRVLFVGERYFSIKRFAEGNGWRTNISQGGRATRHELDDEQLSVARRAAVAVSGDSSCGDDLNGKLLGVDLLPCADGRLLTLEVNAVPGWRGVSNTLGLDIAAEVISHVRGLAAAGSR